MSKKDLILLIDALDAHRDTFTGRRPKIAILEHIDELRQRFMDALRFYDIKAHDGS